MLTLLPDFVHCRKHHEQEKDPMLIQQQKPRKPVEDGVVMYDCSPCLRRFGLHRLIPKESSRVWFVKDICGVICVILTWMLILYAEYVVMFIMLMPSNSVGYKWGNAVLFNFLAFMAVASHSRAMFSDPVSIHMCAHKNLRVSLFISLDCTCIVEWFI